KRERRLGPPFRRERLRRAGGGILQKTGQLPELGALFLAWPGGGIFKDVGNPEQQVSDRDFAPGRLVQERNGQGESTAAALKQMVEQRRRGEAGVRRSLRLTQGPPPPEKRAALASAPTR